MTIPTSVSASPTLTPQPSRGRDIAYALLAVGVVAATSIVGQIATYPNIGGWYAHLTKPPFSPPNWVFAPTWTALYALMAFALWRVLTAPVSADRRRALTLFFVQLALNAAWSWMFFAAQSPLLGLINVVPQWLIIIATIFAFRKVDYRAAWCLIPLAAWVGFAAVLNGFVWALNN